MKISVILPSYQESENLKKILPKMHFALTQTGEDYEILVVDTEEAMDETEAICQSENAHYIRRRGGNFYGDAIRTGIAEASGEYVVVMDADGSHDPMDILQFFTEMKLGKYDVIIGSRYCKGGDSHNGLILKLMSWCLNVTYRVIFHLDVSDVSDSFRMYKTNQVKELSLECENFDIVEEILIRLVLNVPGLRIKEVPIFFNKRAFGKSKRDLVKFIFSYLSTIYRLKGISKAAEKKNVLKQKNSF